MIKLLRTITIATLAALLLPASLRAEAPHSSAERMLNDVKILASDAFEGRGVGTTGLEKAADYIAEEFRKAGLSVPDAIDSPYQEFEVVDGAELGSPNELTFVGPDGTAVPLTWEEDFITCSFGDSGTFSAPLVFAGYGIEADDLEYNDFASIDVEGKVVIIMRRNPLQSNPHGPFATGHGISRHAALSTKVSRAFSRGAKAVLFVNDPYTGRHEAEHLAEQLEGARNKVINAAESLLMTSAENAEETETMREKLRSALTHLNSLRDIVAEHDADPLMEFGYGGTRSGRSLPIFHISQETCNKILRPTMGATLEELEARIDETGKPQSQELTGWTAKGTTTVNVVRVPVRNVVGVLEGAGPHKKETIVIGAHFDHLGNGGEGSLAPKSNETHNGADDNASGTAGLIELARRLANRTTPLPRTILFIAFTGEERGLLGSAHYVKEPLRPLESTVAMLNMDMIGRMEDEKLTIFGSGTSTRWESLLKELASDEGLDLSMKPEGFGPSDHSSFYSKKIPVLHLFTGTHSDYHRPSDDWQKINSEGMERIVNLLEGVVVDVAETEAPPEYVHVQGKATLERTGRRPYFGSIPDFGTDAEGYAIQGVAPGSPAEKAGVMGGDVIIRLGDQRIGGLDDFDLALRKYSAGSQVKVTVLRAGQEVTLEVTLAAPRG